MKVQSVRTCCHAVIPYPDGIRPTGLKLFVDDGYNGARVGVGVARVSALGINELQEHVVQPFTFHQLEEHSVSLVSIKAVPVHLARKFYRTWYGTPRDPSLAGVFS